MGNSELFIKSGSDINLTCVALQAPAPPSFIYWYKGGRVINYSQRGGISVLTERQTRTSKLVISRAMPTDSGNYTCSPSASGMYFLCIIYVYGKWDFAEKFMLLTSVISMKNFCGLRPEFLKFY